MGDLNGMAIVHFMELRGLVMEDQFLLVISVMGHGDVDRGLTVTGFAGHVFVGEHSPMFRSFDAHVVPMGFKTFVLGSV